MTNETVKKVNASELWFLRKMQRISWTAHDTNETVPKQICQVRQLLNTIKNRQLQFFGHIMRQRIWSKLQLLDLSMENEHGVIKGTII